MRLKTAQPGRAVPRAPFIDLPPLGHQQAVVLKVLKELGDDAFGHRVVDRIQAEFERVARGRIADAPQVYACIRKLREDGYIKFSHERASPNGGPPVKIYKVTAAGREALAVTLEHHQSLSAFLAAR